MSGSRCQGGRSPGRHPRWAPANPWTVAANPWREHSHRESLAIGPRPGPQMAASSRRECSLVASAASVGAPGAGPGPPACTDVGRHPSLRQMGGPRKCSHRASAAMVVKPMRQESLSAGENAAATMRASRRPIVRPGEARRRASPLHGHLSSLPLFSARPEREPDPQSAARSGTARAPFGGSVARGCHTPGAPRGRAGSQSDYNCEDYLGAPRAPRSLWGRHDPCFDRTTPSGAADGTRSRLPARA